MKQLTDLATPFASVAEQTTLVDVQPEWLKNLREQAHTQFTKAGLPAKKTEDWKYTSLWGLSQHPFEHDAESILLSPAEISQFTLFDDVYRVVIIDGKFKVEYSTVTGMEKGLFIKPLSAAVDKLDGKLGQNIDIDKPGFNALNTMLMTEGVVIEVENGCKIQKPIEILSIFSDKAANKAAHLRNVVTLGKDAELTIIEHYASQGEVVTLTNVVTEVTLADNAELHHYKLQQESKKAYHIATLSATQAESSQWHTYNVSLGGGLVRNDIHSRLLGEQAHVTMDGLYIVNGTQHVDNHTRIDHAVPNTTSSELYKGVLDDNSHAVFNGKVVVHKDAQKTDANQKNQNLLLSRGCEIDTKPEMEIYADDVKCGHGSTVGQIDEDQLFFFRARGLDESTARNLLTYAFAAEVLENMPSTHIKNAFTKVIEQRLPRGGE
jgi:Fe-S cluster assembly protein SufD